MYNARLWPPLLSEGFGPESANGDTLRFNASFKRAVFVLLSFSSPEIQYTIPSTVGQSVKDVCTVQYSTKVCLLGEELLNQISNTRN